MQENKIGADDLLSLLEEKNTILLNTLPSNEQDYLISNTILIEIEEFIINNLLRDKKKTRIIIYGKNHTDPTVIIKYKQLIKLGYDGRLLYMYLGGLFEWSCLQKINDREEDMDICLDKKYATTSPCNNIFLYQPKSVITHNLITKY